MLRVAANQPECNRLLRSLRWEMLRNGKRSAQTWPSPSFPRPKFVRRPAYFPQGAVFPSSGPTPCTPGVAASPPHAHPAASAPRSGNPRGVGKRRAALESFARINLPEKKEFGVKASNPRRKGKARMRRRGQSPLMQGPAKPKGGPRLLGVVSGQRTRSRLPASR